MKTKKVIFRIGYKTSMFGGHILIKSVKEDYVLENLEEDIRSLKSILAEKDIEGVLKTVEEIL